MLNLPIPRVVQLQLHLVLWSVDHATEIQQGCQIIQSDIGVVDGIPQAFLKDRMIAQLLLQSFNHSEFC